MVSTFCSILDIEAKKHVGESGQLSLQSMQQQLHNQLGSGVPTLAGRVELFTAWKAWTIQTAIKGSCKSRSDVHIPGFIWTESLLKQVLLKATYLRGCIRAENLLASIFKHVV